MLGRFDVSYDVVEIFCIGQVFYVFGLQLFGFLCQWCGIFGLFDQVYCQVQVFVYEFYGEVGIEGFIEDLGWIEMFDYFVVG